MGAKNSLRRSDAPVSSGDDRQMHSQWSETDAAAIVAQYGEHGIAADLALRIYTSRLLGGDRRLVLHGGGNTSVKLTLPDLFGEPAEVMCIKGSGGDLATIEPAGLPAVRLVPLRKLRALAALSDDEMVRHLRASLVDPGAPDPSVETLLHAFLPQRFVDHTHATAVLSLADQPDGTARIADLYGGRVGVVPYLMPGFGLAKKAAEIYEADPAVDGLVLLKHGVASFGADAPEAYERMIAIVSAAEERLKRGRRMVFAPAKVPADLAAPAEIAPIVRGASALPEPATPGAFRRFVLDFRSAPAVRNFVDGAELQRYATAGVATPDHAIRTKNCPLIVPPPERAKLGEFATSTREAVAAFAADYRSYFARHDQGRGKIELDPAPRVVLVPGIGLFGLGKSARDAAIAADLAESWVETVTEAEAVGRFESISEAEAFEIEYWPLEQAKLGKHIEKPLAGQIAAVTGGAGTIGLATAKAFREAGAEIVLLDRAGSEVETAGENLGGLGIVADVTEPAAVRAAFDRIAERLGGVDIVISNAGAAWQGKIGEVSDKVLRESFELNFFAHQYVAQSAVRIMQEQRTGGCLLFNVSRQAISQGPSAGPYGLPKAATLFLMKQYALEYAADGIRANAVNADGIRSGIMTPDYIRSRAQAYGLSEAQYMSRNLLGREVTAEDVAQAFLHLALARNTTGAFSPVDGGNLAAAPR
jgi:rhamnose utilization protein RhaD (predicted bifunctional aldolase and dehydrogenase)/NAD(P)-dependent dehydrogenase (short-subunit alcohol dehydrogenase family)